MSPFKWLSLVVGMTSFALVAGMLAFALGPAWRLAGGSYADALLVGLFIGLLTGGLIWLIGGAYACELRRAVATAQALAVGEEINPTPRGFGLDSILDPVRETRDQLAAELAAADDRCRRLEDQLAHMRGDSLAGVSHELRTPLSSIKGCLEMLLDGEASDLTTRNDFYNIILTETNRLSNVIDSVLSISDVQAGGRADLTTADLGDLVREAVEMISPRARAQRLTLTCDAPPGAAVRVDVDLIRQAVGHLLTNAVKYNRQGGRIDVRLMADRDQGRVELTVSDTGVGIGADERARVFDKFYRVPDHMRLAKGAGLGLFLVRQAVEAVHGGTIGVTSEIGTGSTFTLTLPMAENIERVGASEVADSTPAALGEHV